MIFSWIFSPKIYLGLKIWVVETLTWYTLISNTCLKFDLCMHDLIRASSVCVSLSRIGSLYFSSRHYQRDFIDKKEISRVKQVLQHSWAVKKSRLRQIQSKQKLEEMKRVENIAVSSLFVYTFSWALQNFFIRSSHLDQFGVVAVFSKVLFVVNFLYQSDEVFCGQSVHCAINSGRKSLNDSKTLDVISQVFLLSYQVFEVSRECFNQLLDLIGIFRHVGRNDSDIVDQSISNHFTNTASAALKEQINKI